MSVRPHRAGRDRGSATVWLAALAMLGCCAFAAALGLGAAVAARHRAESAADLAALAAADRLLVDPQDACRRAGLMAAAHGVRLTGCAVGDDAVRVRVEAPLHGLPAVLPPARAEARAGPLRAEGPDPESPAPG